MGDSLSLVHIGLTASSLMALPALFGCWERERYFHAATVLYAMIATALMHMSETKHGLDPPEPWKNGSATFLNMDRIGSYVAILVCLYARWPVDLDRDAHLVLVALLGATCLWIGERTSHLVVYFITHLVWHAVAFYVLHQVLAK